MPTSSCLRCAAALAAALPAVAQTVTLPAHAAGIESQQATPLPFGLQAFRTQMLVEASSIAPVGGVITGLRFRADRTILQWLDQTMPAGSVPNVTVSLSHSSQTLANVSESFAANLTETPTVVFQGTVTLPGYTLANVRAGALPWDVVVPFQTPFVLDVAQGRLLVEITADNAASTEITYWLDAAEPGGSATSFGRRGLLPGNDELSLTVGTGNDFAPVQISPGNALDLVASTFGASPSTWLGVAFAGLAQPLDLGPSGAPDQIAYLLPDALVPLSWTSGFGGSFATATVQVPANPSLVGALLYAQAVAAVPTANPLGYVVSDAVEIRLGDALDTLPMRQVDSDSPFASTGFLVDYSFGFGTPRFGGAALQFEGFFQ